MSDLENNNSSVQTSVAANNEKTLPESEQTLAGSSSLSASVTSLDNVSVASSKISKPSGIRPPSKIGRLCGNHHKPALPTTPTKMAFPKADMSYIDSSDDSLKRINDTFERHRLSDLLEDNEDDVYVGVNSYNGVNRNRYSSFGSTTSSLDAIWDLHPLRLSEAGLSHHSDTSAVLTEDTDSFIIGQKVWVAGSNPGHIAFIGETQFAPGEWAGIALDEPVGKNDGSVNGIRYFQCESKKGVFSRLTRLTREPIEGMSPAHTPSPINNIRFSISPTGSTQSAIRSPVSLYGSSMSISSSASHVIDYKIGDRVIIKSSQGSKVGTVRYMGAAEFAPGDWVGVELDDPRGKNDGSVNGRRYFECRPNFGLFAPVSKVSKSPSKVKPGSCQVHGGTGLPPSGMRRVNSKESLLSNVSNTSAASTTRRVRLGTSSLSAKKSPSKTTSTTTPIPTRTALQDVLKEKQQHIEQLLKEREETESKLTSVEQQFKKYRDESGRKLEEDIRLLNTLKAENTQLNFQLEEEKRKTEDIQFRLEETVICKDDLESKDKSSLTRINELEKQLVSEKERIDNHEKDANKLFEAEENLIKYKEEIDSLKEQLQESRSQQIFLEGDHASTAVLIKSLQDEIDHCKVDLNEKSELINVLNQEISKTTSCFKNELEENLVKYSELEKLCTDKESSLTALKQENEIANKLLDEKSTSLANMINEKLIIETNLEKEIDRLKMELSAKIFDLENAQDVLKGKETNSCDLEKELNSLREVLKERENEKEELKRQIVINTQNLEEVSKKLTSKEEDVAKIKSDIDGVKEEHERIVQSKDLEILELSKSIKNREEEWLEYSKKLNLLQENYEKKLNELKISETNLETLKKQFEEKLDVKEVELKDYQAKLKEEESRVNKEEAAYRELNKNLENVKVELETSKEKNKQYELELNKQKESKQELLHKIEKKEEELMNFKNEIDNLSIKLKNVESTENGLKESIIEENNKLKELMNTLQEKDVTISSLQKELQTIKIDFDSVSNNLQQYQNNLNDVETNLKKERDEIKEVLKEKVKELEDFKIEFNSNIAERNLRLQDLTEDLTNKLKIIEDLQRIKDEDELLKKEREEVNMKEIKSKEEEIQLLLNQILEKDNEMNVQLNTLKELGENVKQKDEELVNFRKLVEEGKETSSGTILKLNSDIEGLSKVNREYLEENEKLKKLLNDSTAMVDGKSLELAGMVEKESRNQEFIKSLQADLTSKNKEVETALNNIQCVQNEKNKAESELKKENEDLKLDVDKLKSALMEKETKIEEVNKHVGKLELLKVGSEGKLKKILEEQTEFEIQVSDLLTKIENKDKELEELREKVKKLSSSEEMMQKELRLSGNLLEGLDSLKSENEAVKKQILESNQRIETLSTENSKLTEELTGTAGKVADLVQNLQEKEVAFENCKIQCDDKIGSLEKVVEEIRVKNEDLERTVGKYKSESESQASLRERLEKEVENMKGALNEKLIRIEELQRSLNEVSKVGAEKDLQLKEQIVEIKKLKGGVVKDVPDGSTNDIQQLLEEKIFAENQVNFLNSIIADMQKKSEEQKARIEILEMGYSSSAVDELTSLGFKMDSKQVPPRMYCDICEEFDLHETEDCPTQGEDEPPNNQLNTDAKIKPPPRDYCDICEAFGHSTENCTEELEF